MEPITGARPVGYIALAVMAVDWSSKAAIASRIPLGDMVVVWEGRLAFWHVRNPAMILGLFGNLPLPWRQALAVLLGAAALVLLLETFSRARRLLPHRRPWAWLFVGLLLGGILGNLGERAVHWWITDFISIGWGGIWLPPGNVADLAIILSIPIAFLVIAFELEARRLRRTERHPPV
jgi:lipoprotein signal peptidase